MKTGLVSISFRKKTCEEILELCVKNKIDCIEWGGDVHVPAGDQEKAKQVRLLSREAGVEIYSYGSYYRLQEHQNFAEEFQKVLTSAVLLGAGVIRIWAGKVSADTDIASYLPACAAELKQVCALAAAEGLDVALEYHRGTLTQTRQNALALVKAADSPNLKLYWQQNPDISHEEHLEEIRTLKPYICNVHTFYWTEGNERRPLAEGKQVWADYISLLGKDDQPYMLEFVRDDTDEQFAQDAAALREFLR